MWRFITDDQLMEATDLKYVKGFGQSLKDVLFTITKAGMENPLFNPAEYHEVSKTMASVSTAIDIYMENPSVAVAWMIRTAKFHELNKVILFAGLTGAFVRPDEDELIAIIDVHHGSDGDVAG